MNSISKVTNLETNTTDGRTQLNEYLESPLQLATGTLSTQTSLSATTLATGGLEGKFIFGPKTEIAIVQDGIERIKIDKTGITVNDGTNNRVKIGGIS